MKLQTRASPCPDRTARRAARRSLSYLPLQPGRRSRSASTRRGEAPDAPPPQPPSPGVARSPAPAVDRAPSCTRLTHLETSRSWLLPSLGWTGRGHATHRASELRVLRRLAKSSPARRVGRLLETSSTRWATPVRRLDHLDAPQLGRSGDRRTPTPRTPGLTALPAAAPPPSRLV